MAVVRFDVERRGSYDGGRSFGDTGAYERIDGRLELVVDPANPRNQSIVDLDKAERGADGLVHFRADCCLLVPADPNRGNHRLLLELPNRGRKLVPGEFNRAKADVPPTGAIPAGDGFLFKHGFSVAWVGWQWDVIRSEALMGLEVPQAVGPDGSPIAGRTVCRFQPSAAHHTHLLADRVHKPYPAADLNEASATLTVRDSAESEPEVISRDRWHFGRMSHGEVLPDAEHIVLDDGFRSGKIYEVVYTTNICPVAGCGLLAIRDAASFFHYAPAPENPCADIERVYAFGMSQTGRMLRHFLYLGLNLDEQDRMAFDGIMSHVGGARRGEFNHRYAQPSVQFTPGFGHRFPYADDPLPPLGDGAPAGLLDRQRASGGMPKVFYTNSSAEYWRGDCALLHIGYDGGDRLVDLPTSPETRIYHFASSQHGPGSLPLTRENTNDGARGRYDFNCLDYTPLLRAALINLDAWISVGQEPPAPAHPRLEDGTAVTRAEVLRSLGGIVPNLHLPDPDHLLRIHQIDLGAGEEAGIGRFPVVEGESYPCFVAAVDENGNELGGVRLPDLTVPVATLTGWNPRDPETGSPEQIMPMQGATFFFAAQPGTDDPRPSLAERYASRETYLKAVRQAAVQLVAERYVLEEDVPLIVANAAERYDAAMAAGRAD